MCLETKQQYTCYCYVTHFHICKSHIAHTRKQIDDKPCPNIQKIFLKDVHGCSSKRACVFREDSLYSFEKDGPSLFDSSGSKRSDQEQRERDKREQRELEKEKTRHTDKRRFKKIKQERLESLEEIKEEMVSEPKEQQEWNGKVKDGDEDIKL